MTDSETGLKVIKYIFNVSLFLWVITFGDPDIMDATIQFLFNFR